MTPPVRAVDRLESGAGYPIVLAADSAVGPGETGLGPEPWSPGQAVAFAVTQVLAAAVLAGAWMALSTELVFTRQIPSVDVAVGAIMAGGTANVAWVAQGRSALRRRKSACIRRAHEVLLRPVVAGPGARPAAVSGDGFVSGPRMTRYHRPGCPLLDGKPIAPVAGLRLAKLAPCGICRPEEGG